MFFLLISFGSLAQNKISGTISNENGMPIPVVEIFNKTDGSRYVSDANGAFGFSTAASGSYDLVFYKDNFLVFETTVFAPVSDLKITLQSINNLSEVVVGKQKEKIFALRKLRDIEETAIYAGKKTEVITLDKISANKAVNNPRQVFAQIVGLTINESSDGGLQLSIGGRGLNPNRTSNFNTRQNDYDISADVLGYPESYYATPTEGLKEIQIVRGAASLQYGTQFGGLVNFRLNAPSSKPMEIITRNTVGSYGLYTNFTSLGGTSKKFSYYTFFNFKTGGGFRPNSHFDSRNFFGNLNYQFTPKTSLHFDYTYFDYLAQQPGGLTDVMFNANPKQSNRKRNWFDVNWNLFALRFKHKFEDEADFSLQLFGLDASRKTVGFRTNRVSTADVDGTVRDLIIGDFVNWGAEARYLKRYKMNGNTNALLFGAKYYQSDNSGIQGPGSSGSNADFDLAYDAFPLYETQSDYKYPNLNLAFFGENIFRVTSRFSITPGFRFEKIRTQAKGSYRRINFDLAGNPIFDETIVENNVKDRAVFLLGVGLSYKHKNDIEFYGNVSQNYRSVTFNDIRTASPSQAVADDITDEKGYTSDIGIRGKVNDKLSFDISVFGLYYNGKIGEYLAPNPNGAASLVRLRDNLGTALSYGFEAMADWNIAKTYMPENDNFAWNVFSNVALTDSEYLSSPKSNKVEFVPLANIKAGTGIGYKNFGASLLFTYVSSQYTDAGNTRTDPSDNTYGIFGEIPSYYVADLAASYVWKRFKLEAGINNFTNNAYFTRRATGYPGPGIIPSDARTFYATLEFRF